MASSGGCSRPARRRAWFPRGSAHATRCGSKPGCVFTGTIWTTLVEAGLGWIVSLEDVKGEFVGRPVLEPQKKNGAPRKLVGFEVLGRGIARHGYPVYLDDNPSGSVTSGTYAPFLQKNIGLCYLPTARATVGTEFEVDVRGRRVKAKVVPTPFYKRAR
jgi:aminomethyltransferase